MSSNFCTLVLIYTIILILKIIFLEFFLELVYNAVLVTLIFMKFFTNILIFDFFNF